MKVITVLFQKYIARVVFQLITNQPQHAIINLTLILRLNQSDKLLIHFIVNDKYLGRYRSKALSANKLNIQCTASTLFDNFNMLKNTFRVISLDRHTSIECEDPANRNTFEISAY